MQPGADTSALKDTSRSSVSRSGVFKVRGENHVIDSSERIQFCRSKGLREKSNYANNFGDNVFFPGAKCLARMRDGTYHAKQHR